MESARSQGHVEILLSCQVMDPARGSFMVHPIPVKRNNNTKTVPNPSYIEELDSVTLKRLQVFRAANHITHTHKGVSAEPHPDAFEYAVSPHRW